MTMEGQQEHSEDLTASEQTSAEPSLFRRAEHHVWRRVASGFLVLVPLLITLWILYIVFSFLDGFIRRAPLPWPLDFPGIGVVLSLVTLYIVGAFFAGQRLRTWQDAVLTRIPIVRSIYGVARQATEALSTPGAGHFSRVVFVEYPRPGLRAMGFVTGHYTDDREDGGRQVVVYIPTVPNPTSGMMAWVPEEEVVDADFTVEEAMKAVFSGGIVLPNEPHMRGLHPSSRQDEEGNA